MISGRPTFFLVAKFARRWDFISYLWWWWWWSLSIVTRATTCVETDGISTLFFGQNIFSSIVEITFLETTWKIGLISQKKLFCCYFFSLYFLNSFSNWTELRQFEALVWDFCGAVYPSGLWISLRKCLKKVWKFFKIFEKFLNFFQHFLRLIHYHDGCTAPQKSQTSASNCLSSVQLEVSFKKNSEKNSSKIKIFFDW